ncbi:MAG: macro domain-containing protein [Lachnospiraceae bacterium]|nr:macro domain-containing protein [Lachnospiraceae bacterium]
MPFSIVRNDITKIKADVIVNTANPLPRYASGTDYAIYKAAGEEELLKERKKIGIIEAGKVAVTSANKLDAKYIVHTVGPSWEGGENGEFEILRSCYLNSLAKADELKCNSIAFPLIATGVYGFPKDKALSIAIQCFSEFLLEHDMDIVMVVFDSKAFELSGRILNDVSSYVDENYVYKRHEDEYGVSGTYLTSNYSSRRRRELRLEEIRTKENKTHSKEYTSDSVDNALSVDSENFHDMLFRLIDESGMTDPEVYKNANMDRKMFSKIRSNPNYTPRKKNIVGLCFALKLSKDDTDELLKRAGIALSPGNRFDVIISYFINHKIYDVYEVNACLFKYGEDLIGSF